MHHWMRRMTLTLAICLAAIVHYGAPDAVEAQIRVDAVLGEPFGVGRIDVAMPESAEPEALGRAGLGLTEANGRVLYPAVHTAALGEAVRKEANRALDQSQGPVGQFLRDLPILRDVLNRPPGVRVYFLFRGSAPLELALQSRRVDTLVVRPRSDAAAYQRLMRLWWREYTTRRGGLLRLVQGADYPPLVENYLEATLADRLGLRLPPRATVRSEAGGFLRDLDRLMGGEMTRLAYQQDRVLARTAPDQPADQALPEPMAAPELALGEVPDDVAVEPMAHRVPAECFYVRFGSFGNFLWFQDTLGLWENDLQNLVALRGLSYEAKKRIEGSLVLEMSVLARLLGDAVVADVAIVGTDPFFQDGGSFGILFHARTDAVLAAEFTRQREARTEEADGATLEKVTVADREVTLLSTPDGSVRSYYASDDGFHFVTRSKTLAERFLETGAGKGSLGASKEFRYARSVMPTDRDDTVFVYVSDAFFRNFTGPRYRTEAVRRMQATADVELVQLALLASAAEGEPGATIEQLVAGRFLPAGFGTRPDGSRTVLADGEAYDSLRGRRGAMIPAPDVEVTGVSAAEADAYRQFGEMCQSRFGRLDPIVIGLKRKPLGSGREQVVIDARVTPFNEVAYQRLREELGEPSPKRFTPLLGNGIELDVVYADQRVFTGVQEIHPPSADWIDYGLWRGIRDLFVGYSGTIGDRLGRLAPLNAGIVGPANAAGYSSSPGERMWRRDFGEYTLFSLQPDLLATVAPQLELVEAERPAQVRLHIEDVSTARIYRTLNNFGYARTRQTCRGNLRLLHALNQQLRVPGDYCKNAAELLLDAKLVCPLGGEYVYQADSGGAGFWTSTLLGPRQSGGLFTTEAPEGFVAPPLDWFRGLDLDVTATPQAVSIHADLMMQMPAPQLEE